MKQLYRIALPLVVSIALPGCEALLIPNGKAMPKPAPTPAVVVPTQEPIRLEILVKGEGRVEVGGNGSIDVKTAANSSESPNTCQCGCGKSGCVCLETRDLSSKSPSMTLSDAGRKRQHAGEVVFNQPEIIVMSPASFTCGACELAVSSLRALGVSVEQRKQDGLGLYPVIKNQAGEEYKLHADGHWRVGRDDVNAKKQLCK